MKNFILAVGVLLSSMGTSFAPGAFANEEMTTTGYKPFRTSVHFNWKPETSTAILRFSTGCLSAHSGGKLTDDLSVDVDRDSGRFEIKGSFLYQAPKDFRLVGSADCMGSRQKEFEITNLVHGTYEVLRGGNLLWTLDLGDMPLGMTEGMKAENFFFP